MYRSFFMLCFVNYNMAAKAINELNINTHFQQFNLFIFIDFCGIKLLNAARKQMLIVLRNNTIQQHCDFFRIFYDIDRIGQQCLFGHIGNRSFFRLLHYGVTT